MRDVENSRISHPSSLLTRGFTGGRRTVYLRPFELIHDRSVSNHTKRSTSSLPFIDRELARAYPPDGPTQNRPGGPSKTPARSPSPYPAALSPTPYCGSASRWRKPAPTSAMVTRSRPPSLES